MSKPVDSEAGTIKMTNGEIRHAWRNTYSTMKFSADGRTAETVTEIRIEFLIDSNAARSTGRKFRKANAKQAASFLPS
jgi:hypothetical protein